MKKMVFLLIAIFVVNAVAVVVPDFTVTDIYGKTHNLTDYTSAGKYVLLELSMAEN